MAVEFMFIILLILAAVVIGFLIISMRALTAISDVQKADIARKKVTLELSEDVGRFGTWYLDAKTGAVQWSDYVYDMHHRLKSLGEPALENAIDYYHADDRQSVDKAIRRAMNGGEDFEFRARILTETGKELPVLSRGTCQFDRHGSVVGIFGCCIDISLPDER